MALTLKMVEGAEESTLVRARPTTLGSGKLAPPPRAPQRCPTCEQRFSGEAMFCPFDGDPLVLAPDLHASPDPLVGTTIEGRYEVLAVIGEGGMGTVYEVRHAALGRRFAVKVMRRDLADAEHTARFVQEAKAAAAIGHPNIVAVSDFGELRVGGSTVPFFVMEHLTGASLAAELRAGLPLDRARVFEVFSQVAAGLGAAHAAGVVHRDLKPDNIFVAKSGDGEIVKLLDFGVAKMVGAGRLTRAGIVFGTPHYMSPEQAGGQPVDHRTDIYAFGVILYEALTGAVPFEADTYMGVIERHLFTEPEPLEERVSDPSRLEGLAPIAMKCLAKNPDERFASMIEVGAALAAAREAERDAAAPSSAARASRSSRPAGRPIDESAVGEVDGVPKPRSLPSLVAIAGGLGAVVAAGALIYALASSPTGHDANVSHALAGVDASAPASTAAPPPPTGRAAEGAQGGPPAASGMQALTAPRATGSAVPSAAAAPSVPSVPSVTSVTSPSGSSARLPASTVGSRPRPTRPASQSGDVVNPWK